MNELINGNAQLLNFKARTSSLRVLIKNNNLQAKLCKNNAVQGTH